MTRALHSSVRNYGLLCHKKTEPWFEDLDMNIITIMNDIYHVGFILSSG